MKRLAVILVFIFPSVYGQGYTLTIDVDGIQKKNKPLTLDSVIFDSKRLLKFPFSKCDYILPENMMMLDTITPLYLYIKDNEYTIDLGRGYLTYCHIHKITFTYYKRRFYN